MKKTTLLFMTAACALGVFAQGGPNFGVKGGYGLAMLHNQNWMSDPKLTLQPGLGWSAGLAIGYNMVYYNYGLAIEFNIKEYNYGHKEKLTGSISHFEDALKAHYLDIPFFFRLRPAGNAAVRDFTHGGFYIEVGPQASFLMNAVYSHKDTLSTNNVNNQDVKGDFSSFNVAAVFGLGFHQIGLERLSVTHGIRLMYGFLDVSQGKVDLLGRTYTSYKPTSAVSASYLLSIIYKIPVSKR